MTKTGAGPLELQEHRVAGNKLVDTVRELLREGNVRRVIVKSEDGTIIMEIPVGAVGALLLPAWMALGAITSLATHYRIAVEVAPVFAKIRKDAPFVFHSTS